MAEKPAMRLNLGVRSHMITREECERIVSGFIVELNHVILNTGAGDIQSLSRFERNMGAYLADLRNPTEKAHQALYSAFGLVDEFIDADRTRVFAAAFEAYQLGESNRASEKSPKT